MVFIVGSQLKLGLNKKKFDPFQAFPEAKTLVQVMTPYDLSVSLTSSDLAHLLPYNIC